MSKHTPGPWKWYGNSGSNDIYLATQTGGRRFVMQFARWGMQGAQPRFQIKLEDGCGYMEDAKNLLKFEVGDHSITGEKAAREDGSVYRYDIRDIDHPDANLIAAAPDLHEALKIVVEGYEEIHPDNFDWNAWYIMANRALTKAKGGQG